MPRPQKYRDVIKFMKTQGWVFLRQGKGSHEIWGLPDESVMHSIPHHEVGGFVLSDLMKKLPTAPRGWR